MSDPSSLPVCLIPPGQMFTVKMSEGVVATSYSKGDKFFIDPQKLLPLERFMPKAKGAPGAGGRGGEYLASFACMSCWQSAHIHHWSAWGSGCKHSRSRVLQGELFSRKLNSCTAHNVTSVVGSRLSRRGLQAATRHRLPALSGFYMVQMF